MKKITKVALLLLVALLSVALLSACLGGNDTKEDESTTESQTEPETAPHFHEYTGEWTVVTEPTCAAEGLREIACACGEKKSAAIPTNSNHALDENAVCTACGKDLREDFTFELNAAGDGYIVKEYRRNEGNMDIEHMVIPATYEGKPVTAIGHLGFSNNDELKSLTIPTTVTSIRQGSLFYYCDNVETVTIKEGNPVYHSVDNCIIETATKTLVVGCKTGVIPADGSVTAIGNNAFANCSNLTEIVIPEGIVSIGSSVFVGCEELTQVTLPDSLTSIGAGAFQGSGLTELAIPRNVLDIGTYMISACPNLESVTVSELNPKYHSAGNCIIETAGKTLLMGCKASVIPADDSVTLIAIQAFFNCSGLTEITIPASVAKIDSLAFSGCTGLTTLEIDNGLVEIGGGAFRDCISLTSVALPNSVELVGSTAFEGCTSVTSVTFGSGLETVKYDAFRNCTALTNVNMGYSVTTIEDGVFKGCTALQSITIPASVSLMAEGVFGACTSLTAVTFLDPAGWQYVVNADNDEYEDLPEADLADPATAAIYLTSTYVDRTWSNH